MDKLKQWLALSLLALLAILAGGWFLLIAPERSEAADLRSQAEAEQLTNDQLETQLEVLRAKAEELPEKQAELAEVARKVPAGPALPELVRALTAAAREAGVVLASVTPGTPVPLVADAPAVPAAPVEGAQTPAAPAPGTAASSGGLSQVPLVLDVQGDFYETEQFLALLEELPRAVRVTSLVVQVGEDSATSSRETLRSTVTASAYMTSAAAASASAPSAAAPAAPAVGGPTGTGATGSTADSTAPAQ